jgi:hypothetical protein
MIVYNVTYKVRWSILDRWLAWLQSGHIAAHMATGLFDSHRVFRLLEQDEEEGPTYIVQYFTTSHERYRQFMIQFAPDLQQDSYDRWEDGFIAFRTVLEEIRGD